MSSIKNTQIDGDVSIGRNASIGGQASISGSATIGHNLKVKGWLDAPNIKGVVKGVFLSKESLKRAYPRPLDGWLAGVGSSTPFDAYIGYDGEWQPTKGKIDIGADTSYAEEISGMRDDIDDFGKEVEEIGHAVDNHTTQLTSHHERLDVLESEVAEKADKTSVQEQSSRIDTLYRESDKQDLSIQENKNGIIEVKTKLNNYAETFIANPVASSESNGLMSAEDKAALDSAKKEVHELHYRLQGREDKSENCSAYTDPFIFLGEFSGWDVFSSKLKNGDLMDQKYMGRCRARVNGIPVEMYQFVNSFSQNDYTQVILGNVSADENGDVKFTPNNFNIIHRQYKDGVWTAWQRINSHPIATPSSDGLMSAQDKAKLENYPSQFILDLGTVSSEKEGESRAASSEVAGNRNISFIRFQIQGVSNLRTTLILQYPNGDNYTAQIKFVDKAQWRRNVTGATGVKGAATTATQWERTAPHYLGYDAANRKIQLKDYTQTVSRDVQLPLVSASSAGLLSPDMYTNIEKNTNDIAAAKTEISAAQASIKENSDNVKKLQADSIIHYNRLDIHGTAIEDAQKAIKSLTSAVKNLGALNDLDADEYLSTLDNLITRDNEGAYKFDKQVIFSYYNGASSYLVISLAKPSLICQYKFGLRNAISRRFIQWNLSTFTVSLVTDWSNVDFISSDDKQKLDNYPPLPQDISVVTEQNNGLMSTQDKAKLEDHETRIQENTNDIAAAKTEISAAQASIEENAENISDMDLLLNIAAKKADTATRILTYNGEVSNPTIQMQGIGDYDSILFDTSRCVFLAVKAGKYYNTFIGSEDYNDITGGALKARTAPLYLRTDTQLVYTFDGTSLNPFILSSEEKEKLKDNQKGILALESKSSELAQRVETLESIHAPSDMVEMTIQNDKAQRNVLFFKIEYIDDLEIDGEYISTAGLSGKFYRSLSVGEHKVRFRVSAENQTKRGLLGWADDESAGYLSHVTKIVIPEGWTELPANCFESRKHLEEVVLPSTLRVVGGNCFQDLPALRELVIPKNVTTINWSAVNNCAALKSIRVGGWESMPLTISFEAFRNCAALTCIEILPCQLTFKGSTSPFSNLPNLNALICHLTTAPTFEPPTPFGTIGSGTTERKTLYRPAGVAFYDEGYWQTQLCTTLGFEKTDI